MGRVEGMAANPEGVGFEPVLRVAARFAGDVAEVGAKCWGREERWIEHVSERGT